jgi:hypothetical protein
VRRRHMWIVQKVPPRNPGARTPSPARTPQRAGSGPAGAPALPVTFMVRGAPMAHVDCLGSPSPSTVIAWRSSPQETVTARSPERRGAPDDEAISLSLGKTASPKTVASLRLGTGAACGLLAMTVAFMVRGKARLMEIGRNGATRDPVALRGRSPIAFPAPPQRARPACPRTGEPRAPRSRCAQSPRSHAHRRSKRTASSLFRRTYAAVQ